MQWKSIKLLKIFTTSTQNYQYNRYSPKPNANEREKTIPGADDGIDVVVLMNTKLIMINNGVITKNKFTSRIRRHNDDHYIMTLMYSY